MAKRVVTSERLMQPIAHFSHGVRVGSTVHLGAAAGVDKARRLAGANPGTGDALAQTAQMFANLRIALEALGLAWSDVARTRTYLVDWRDLAAYEGVYARQFDGRDGPPTAIVGTWGFPLPQILVETELVAYAPGAGDRLHHFAAHGVDGGAHAQADHALRSLRDALERAGLGLADVAKLEVTLADMRALAAFDEVFARHVRAPYPARSVVGAPLASAGRLVTIEATAARGATPIEAPGGSRWASAGTRAGDWAFVSAQQGDAGASAEAQTRAAWERTAAVLDAAGLSLDDVVRTNNVLVDWRDYAAFNAGYGAFVTRPYPPRATVCGALSEAGALVQIEAIAHARGRDATVLEAAVVA